MKGEDLEGEDLPGGELRILGRARAKKRNSAPEVGKGQQGPVEGYYTPVEELVDEEVRLMIEADKKKFGKEYEGKWD